MEKKDLRILVVEDDPIIATDLRSLLRSEGYGSVETALNMRRAELLLEGFRPHFCILDIHLGPGPGGIDLAELLHSRYRLPYIFLTSFSDAETLAAAREQSPYGYLVKPFQEKTLLTTIDIALSNHQRLQQSREPDLSACGADLTPREQAICRQLCRGSSYRQICDESGISINTLKYHVKNIYLKTGVAGRAELTARLLG